MKPLIALLLLVGLASCSPPEPPLRVGILEWPPFEIVRLAERMRYWPDSGIELVEFRSPTEAARAYVAGGLDIIALNLDLVLELAARDDDHRVIVVIDESLGGDAVISREPLAELRNIAGKRVGMQAGELGAHMLNRLLDHAGLSPGDLEVVSIDFPDQPLAFSRGDVDLMITYEPVRSQLVAAGGHEIFSSAQIPGEIIDVFVARRSLIEQRRDDYLTFTRGWFTAVQTFHDDPSACAALLATRFDLDAADFLAMLEGVRLFSLADNHAVLGPGNEEFLASIGNFASSVRSFSEAAAAIDLDRLLTTVALPARGGAVAGAAGAGGC